MDSLNQIYNKAYENNYLQVEHSLDELQALLAEKYEQYNIEVSKLYDAIMDLKDKFKDNNSGLISDITDLCTDIDSSIQFILTNWENEKKDIYTVYVVYHFFKSNDKMPISLQKLRKQSGKECTYEDILELWDKYAYLFVTTHKEKIMFRYRIKDKRNYKE